MKQIIMEVDLGMRYIAKGNHATMRVGYTMIAIVFAFVCVGGYHSCILKVNVVMYKQ